jgi:hypothetical protein
LEKKNHKLFVIAKNIYDHNKYIPRSFAFAYEYLTKYDDYAKQVEAYKTEAQESLKQGGGGMLGYLAKFKPNPTQKYDVQKDDIVDSWYQEEVYPDGIISFRLAVGFWLRRGIDGSALEFKKLMDIIMNEYDAQWYAQHKVQ